MPAPRRRARPTSYENAFARMKQARPIPTIGRPVHRGVAPIDCGPVFLLMPFGFHLAMDTLPSGELQADGCRSALACIRLSLSCPFKLLHTSPLLRPARHYPRVWIRRSSFERRRDFNPPEQRAAQRTIQSSPSLIGVSVLSASRSYRLRLFPCQTDSDGIKTGAPPLSGKSMAITYLLAMRCPVYRQRDFHLGFDMEHRAEARS